MKEAEGDETEGGGRRRRKTVFFLFVCLFWFFLNHPSLPSLARLAWAEGLEPIHLLFIHRLHKGADTHSKAIDLQNTLICFKVILPDVDNLNKDRKEKKKRKTSIDRFLLTVRMLECQVFELR